MPEISELQKCQLGILNVFIGICAKHNLRYFMAEGSMLGTYRHKGFIPWDDDIDVSMPRKDYEKFQVIAKESLPGPYKLTNYKDEGHYWMTAILWDTSKNVILSNATEKIVRHPWIDVAPLDGMPKSKIRQRLHYAHYYLYRALFQASYFSKIVNVQRQRPFYERICVKMCGLMNVEKWLVSTKWGGRLHSVMSKYDYDESDYVVAFISDYKLREVMPKTWYGDGRIYDFECLSVRGVSDPNNYLAQLYGDYMKLPPKDKRVGKHNAELR